MSAWDDYVEWSGLDEAKLRHPAGKGIPASAEVQARMDDEACAVGSSNWDRFNEWHHGVSTSNHWLNWFIPVVFYGPLLAASAVSFVLSDLGGWGA